jgi:hypothetical protein
MRAKDDALARQWQLPFREDQIWDAMPESTRKDCRALFEELLKETLNRLDRRESNERQD